MPWAKAAHDPKEFATVSSVGQALLINAIVLVAVLEADAGPHRKITRFRVLRPIILAGAIIPVYLKSFASHGTGLALEIAGTVAGVILGLAATTLMSVYRSPRTGRPVSRAGLGYAVLWIVVIGARSAFSYGSHHWFSRQLGTWMTQHTVTADALTDALIMMAVTMLLTRTLSIAARASSLPKADQPHPMPANQ
jgi:hypothetical protein